MFSYKMVILKGIWIFFALALPLHFPGRSFFQPLFFIQFHSLHTLDHRGRGCWSSFEFPPAIPFWINMGRIPREVNGSMVRPSVKWRMKPGSVPYQASGILVNFTPRLQLRGGVERIPGFMRSESRDAARAAKTS